MTLPAAMTPDGRDGEEGGLDRRSFMKYGGLLIGGGAASGLDLTGAELANAAGEDGARRTTLRAGRAVEVGMSQARLEDVAACVQSRVTRGLMPGAAILVARHGRVVLERAFGDGVVNAVTSEARKPPSLLRSGSHTSGLHTSGLVFRIALVEASSTSSGAARRRPKCPCTALWVLHLLHNPAPRLGCAPWHVGCTSAPQRCEAPPPIRAHPS